MNESSVNRLYRKVSPSLGFVTRPRCRRVFLLTVCVLFTISSLASAQLATYDQNASYSKPASENPFANIGLDQRLNEQLPLMLSFRDETGKTVQLGDYFGEKPVILSFAYYDCPMLCTLVINGLIRTLRTLSFSAGKEFNVVTVSFNPKDTPPMAATKRQTSLQSYSRKGAETGWHFLTGDEKTIQQLTQAVGFRYAYDENAQQYQHPTGIMVLTPNGKLSRYFYGIEYAPRDVRLGLIEASAGKIGPKSKFSYHGRSVYTRLTRYFSLVTIPLSYRS